MSGQFKRLSIHEAARKIWYKERNMEKLTKLEKRILVNRLKTHFTLAEIAKILGMSNSTVVKYSKEFAHDL